MHTFAALRLVWNGATAAIVFFAPLLGQCVKTVRAGTVSGVWNLAGSPYCAGGDIQVAALTIQPGVRVVFGGAYSFEAPDSVAVERRR